MKKVVLFRYLSYVGEWEVYSIYDSFTDLVLSLPGISEDVKFDFKIGFIDLDDCIDCVCQDDYIVLTNSKKK